MLIGELAPFMQSLLLDALCESLGGWEPTEKFKENFPKYEVAGLSEYFDVSKYLKSVSIVPMDIAV